MFLFYSAPTNQATDSNNTSLWKKVRITRVMPGLYLTKEKGQTSNNLQHRSIRTVDEKLLAWIASIFFCRVQTTKIALE